MGNLSRTEENTLNPFRMSYLKFSNATAADYRLSEHLEKPSVSSYGGLLKPAGTSWYLLMMLWTLIHVETRHQQLLQAEDLLRSMKTMHRQGPSKRTRFACIDFAGRYQLLSIDTSFAYMKVWFSYAAKTYYKQMPEKSLPDKVAQCPIFRNNPSIKDTRANVFFCCLPNIIPSFSMTDLIKLLFHLINISCESIGVSGGMRAPTIRSCMFPILFHAGKYEKQKKTWKVVQKHICREGLVFEHRSIEFEKALCGMRTKHPLCRKGPPAESTWDF